MVAIKSTGIECDKHGSSAAGTRDAKSSTLREWRRVLAVAVGVWVPRYGEGCARRHHACLTLSPALIRRARMYRNYYMRNIFGRIRG